MNRALLDRLRSLYPTAVGDPPVEVWAALYAVAEIESALDPKAIGGAGETSAWQVLPATAKALGMPATPQGLLDQAEWIAPLVASAARDGAFENLPRWWRHGHLPATPTPLDFLREAKFEALYKAAAAVEVSKSGGKIFPAPPALPALPKETLMPPTLDVSKFKAQLDIVRAKADQVRKTIDLVAGIVTSVPIIGAVAGGYVRSIVLAVDGLDDAIDVLDQAVDASA